MTSPNLHNLLSYLVGKKYLDFITFFKFPLFPGLGAISRFTLFPFPVISFTSYSKFVKLLYALVWAITFTTFFSGLGAIPTKLSQRKEKCTNSKNLCQARQNFYRQSLPYMSRWVFTCWLSEFETYWAIYWRVQWTYLPDQKDGSLSNTKQETPSGYW